MCIAFLALATHSEWPLFIAANRDEFHARPTLAAAPWSETPAVYGGLDLVAGGTWFAMTQTGRFALLTNYRDLSTTAMLEPLSRGKLCKDFVESEVAPHDYLTHVSTQAHRYEGFNLLVGAWATPTQQFECFYFSNRSTTTPQLLRPGYYVLSNHLLNTPWPKSVRLAAQLKQLLDSSRITDTEAIYQALRDNQQAADTELPPTGLSLERERLLSSPFIVSPDYGTRSSSIWTVAQNGHSLLHECSYNPQGLETERHSWPVRLRLN